VSILSDRVAVLQVLQLTSSGAGVELFDPNGVGLHVFNV
jgi:hypothetical protein